MTEKMLGRARLILLAAMPLLLSLCSRTEELLPDTSPSDKKTVTITVRSSETIAGQGTKTTLGQDGRVIWNEGDYVSVNNQRFPVIPDPDDPTMATVEGVPESPEYVAWVGNGYFYDTYWSLTFDYYIGYEQSRKNMPMVAYSTDTNLEFKNIGGVVRLGVTGTQTLNTINLVTNDGSTIAGMLNVPVDDFVSGELKDSYGEPENLSGNGTVSSIEFYYDSEDEFVTLSPSSPEYFDFCIPSRVYEGGFTVILDDIDGNVAVKKVSSPVEVLRSTIVPMQTFAFEPVPEPAIEVTETTDSTISFTVTAEPGMGIRAGVLYSSLYETLPEKEGYFDDDWETRDDYAETAIYESEDGYKTTGEDGTCEFRFSKVCNDEGWYVKMNAGTGYRIAVSYFIDTENEHLMFGKPVLLETATEEAAGEGPEFEAKLLADTCSYTNMVMQINTFSEVSELRAFVWPQKEYDRYIGNGMTDVEIVSQVNAEIRGMYNYYSIAENATVIKNFAFILEYSMYKTFGLKYRKSVYKIQKKYRENGIFMVPYNTKKGLKYCEFYHDGFKKKRYACSFEPDLLPQYVKYDNPNYLRTRIKLGVCELCGENTDDICMHHVKSLKSIKADNEWNTIMLAKRRKTLAVCPNCYAKITK